MLARLYLILEVVTAVSFASPVSAARDTTQIGPLYAYGQNITGLPLYFADGKALLGNEFPATYQEATNVTFSTDSDKHFIATPTNTSVGWTQKYLSIDHKSNSYEPARFDVSNSTSDTTSTSTGFLLFGRILSLLEDGQYQSAWYAVETKTEGIYTLAWNNPNKSPNSTSTVVVLKNDAPAGLPS